VPFLRVIRDKRGYETTYLMHWYREGGRQRSRILYVFRTPGGVRVGRDPLSPDVQRQLEARHPDIAFDWGAVKDNQQIIEPAPDLRRRRPGPGARREDAPPAQPPPIPTPEPAVVRTSEAAAPPAPARPPIPSAIQGGTADEQIAFLLQWYPKVRERIPLRVSDPARQEALFALAERLNPAAWTDADQITSGLQSATEALERLTRVFGKRRRRARKRPLATSAEAAPAQSATSESSASESTPSEPTPPEPTLPGPVPDGSSTDS
jgi:hypothetical protein